MNYFYVALFAIGSVAFLYSADYVFEKVLQPHQRIRIEVLLGMEEDLAGAGYNVNQSKIAIGSGGFFGKGFLNGTQTKLKKYLVALFIAVFLVYDAIVFQVDVYYLELFAFFDPAADVVEEALAIVKLGYVADSGLLSLEAQEQHKGDKGHYHTVHHNVCV